MNDGRHSRSAAPLLIALATLSGMGGLVYELLYLRILTTHLGDMYYVHVWLLGTFLLGHGLGAWLAHRLRHWLPATEMAIGVYGLLFGGLLAVYSASPLSQLFSDPVLQSAFLSVLSLIVPAVCIGISIPLFSLYIEESRGANDGFKISYFVYHVAAAVSVLATEFLLIRAVGLQHTLRGVALVNISCGLLLWLNRSRWRSVLGDPPALRRAMPPRILAAVACSSLAASLYVAFYLKATYHLFRPHRENFAISTASLVLAIAAGSALIMRDRLSFRRVLSLACLALGLWAAWPLIAEAYDVLRSISPSFLVLPAKMVFGLLLALPYVFFGATLPALVPDETAIARRSGLLLWISGLANAVGFGLYTLVVHPGLPVFSAPAVIWGLAVVAILWAGRMPWTRLDTALVAGGGLFCALIALQPDGSMYLTHHRNLLHTPEEMVHFKSASDHVTLVRHPQRQRIFYNGFPSIQVSADGRPNRAEVIAGAHVIHSAPRRRRAMVLGMGTGITAGAVATGFAHTDVVEINAGFFDLAPEIAEANFAILTNPRAHLHHDDGRRFLSRTAEDYDAIVNSIPAPTFFSAGKVYTREFYRLVKGSLRDDGIFATWLTFADMSTAGAEALLATLADEFRYGQLTLLRAYYYLLICSDVPVPRRGLAAEDVPEPILNAVQSLSPGEPLATVWDALLLSPDIFPGVRGRSTRRNTDDFPVLEFEIMRRVHSRDESFRRDLFVMDPDRFHIGIGDASRPEAFRRQAAVVEAVHPALFQSAYHPTLARLASSDRPD